MNKNNTDLLMIFPSGGALCSSNFKFSLGSAYIIAYLKKNGIRAKQFISNESYNVKYLVKKITDYNPKTVGFTVYETNYMQSVLISRGLKRYNPDIIIIFGGPSPTVLSKEILEDNLSVDICVRGEGEETTLELLSKFSENNFNLNNCNLDNINGITFRKENEVIINPESNILLSNRFVKNFLDKYPSPYLSKIIPASEASLTGIITARGCNQNCIYCNCSVLSKRNIFFHSIERVLEELSFLSEYKDHIGPIQIHDDGFTILPTRAKRICEGIIENNIKLHLSCITRCDTINEDLIDLMKEAGFISLGFSLESAVPRVLRTIGKVSPPQSKDQVNFNKEAHFIESLKHMTAYAKKAGIKIVFASIMVGLPGETIQDAQKTIEFVNRLGLTFYQHNYFRIFIGTPIHNNYKKFGYKVKLIGKKNKVMTQNDFPFNVYKVKLAQKSTMEKESRATDFNNLKILALNSNRTIQKPYFDNIIINSNFIKHSLANWIQENLMINGKIIQIYSNKKKYERYHSKNLTTLYNELMPTLYYESYYWESLNYISTLVSEKISLLGEKMGLLIKFRNTDSALQEFKIGNNNQMNFICIDHTKSDTYALYNLLLEISKRKDYFNYLLESKPIPYFHHLCRWTSNLANCHTLETAIIDNNNSIRICWNSTPIGRVGNSISELIQNLKSLLQNNTERRKCNECIENERCIKCIFPYPLSFTEYCEFRKRLNTGIPANIINSFNIFKELLYNPTKIIDL